MRAASWSAAVMPRFHGPLALVLGGFALVGCRATHPSQLPTEPGWIVAVKSCRLSGATGWYKSLAHHAWLDIKRGSEEEWVRVENGASLFGVRLVAIDAGEARLDARFGGNGVRLLGWVEGEAAQRVAVAIEARARELDPPYATGYRVWPGPNSNTLVRELAAVAPELGFVFDPNCIGKDYPGWVDVGLTASRTGVRVDTVPLGFAVGLREGLEVHVLGMTLGVSLDPPGLSLPFLPQIPWGWLPGAPPNLRAPEVAGAVRMTIDAAALTGDRCVLGTLRSPSVLLFECADGSGWTRVDLALGKRLTTRSRQLHVELRQHGPDGVGDGSIVATLDSTAPPQGYLVGCGNVLGFLEFEEQADELVRVSVRWRGSLEELQKAAK